MTIEEFENRLESVEKQVLALQHDIQKFTAKLADEQDEPEIPDAPVFCVEPLYFVHSDFSVIGSEFSVCTGIVHGGFNAFHTKEYAQEFADKCKLIAMMLHCKWYLDRDYVPNWKNVDENKFIVYYDNQACCFHITQRTLTDVWQVSFSTPDAARKCAEWLNEHWRDGNAD